MTLQMNPASNYFRTFLLVFVCMPIFCSVAAGQSNSTITGVVYDESRNPVIDVDVELLDDLDRTRFRTRTNGVGQYTFEGLNDGRYTVRVMPFRHNLEEKSEEVVITSLSILGNTPSTNYKDIYLKRRKGGLGETTTGVIFVQEVPVEAESAYKDAMNLFDNDNHEAAVAKLIEALRAFPTYFAAAQRLASEYSQSGQYLDAAKLYIRAAEANPKSSITFYSLGYAFHMGGKEYNKAALVSLAKAKELAPASFQVELLMGKIERQEGNFVDAEKHLLTAKKLSDVRVPEIHIELAQLYGNDLKDFGKAADELELYLKASNKKDEEIKKKIDDLREKAKKS